MLAQLVVKPISKPRGPQDNLQASRFIRFIRRGDLRCSVNYLFLMLITTERLRIASS